MKQYLDLIRRVKEEGIPISPEAERTGTGTRSVYGEMMKFDLADGFPLVTTKKTFFRGVVEELLWFLRGETNSRTLEEKGVNIWKEWAHPETGELGPVYGAQWRNWKHYEDISISILIKNAWREKEADQLAELISNLKSNPHSRRHIVTGWNPGLLPDPKLSHQENVENGKQVLPPCHTLWQVSIGGDQKVNLQLYQRSADVFLGLPFNIASYSLLLLLIANYLDREPGTFIWTGHDCHLYNNHMTQVDELLQRNPLPLPTIKLNYDKNTPLWEVKAEDIELVGYQSHPAIKAPVAI